MADSIQFRRGLRSAVKPLPVGMPGFIEDEERLVIGKGDGTNTELPSKADMDNINSQMAEIAYNIKFLGAKIDGTTDDSDIVQSILNNISNNGGGKVISPSGTMVINKSITVPSNIVIDFSKTKITPTLTGDNLPIQFFLINGSNIDISIDIELDIANVNASTKARAIEFQTGGTFDNIKIHNCKTRYTYYGVYGFNIIITNCEIENNNFVDIYNDIKLNKVFGNNLNISKNYFPIERNWSTPTESFGEIHVCAGFDKDNNDEITDDIYLNNCFKHLFIENNSCYRSNHRMIYVINALDVHINNNSHEGKVGDITTLGCSDDVYILEFCRNFSISNNQCGTSGQNGIDCLASQHGSVVGNTCMQICIVGLMFDMADTDTLGHANNLSPQYRIPFDIAHHGNTLNANESCIQIRLGQQIVGGSNSLSLFDISVENPAYTKGANLHFSQATNDNINNFITANPNLNIKNIKFDNDVIDTDKANIFFANKNNIAWGTIKLSRSLAIQSDWIAVTPLQTYAWVHNSGLYDNVEIWYQYSDTKSIKIHQMVCKMEDSVLKTKGIQINWQDKNQVIINVGDYILDGSDNTEGPGANLGKITSGNIKVITY
ncbi:glycoside hydrolase family 55 protein [Clostridium tyrobutyricum]|uniref:glycoside hydrolase family 55 protein n=1 Tax=Clostridium tyrobutyricum TaxID=1519 RepID=UPI001C391A09|nr:glycoside hydrolase family 55 protein [Clostridium tyrobutyricum]MBV4423667.1 glycoside hydrolase family 55 protein [Clostridium tyrobutyricum]